MKNNAAQIAEPLEEIDDDKVDILLVDDLPEKMLALESVLAELNQRVYRASSGSEALRLLLKRDFAVILLDVNMPGMDGFETAQLIRQRKNSEYTPIIFITAVGVTEGHQSLGYSLGAVDYIFSPIIPEILKTKVGIFVELFKRTRQVRQLNERLKRHAAELEQKVEERTAELSKANQELQNEVSERSKIQQALEAANEELLRLSQIKSDFTAMVSHELRTPLHAIKEGIDIVIEGVDGPVTREQLETLGIAKSNVDRLARLINNVLDFAKVEAGRLMMDFEPTNLNHLIVETYHLMKMATDKKKIRFQLDLPEERVMAVCDADKMRQVLINVLDNAIKFTRASGEIRVGLASEGGRVRIAVSDTGAGIAPGDQGRIFEMFGQSSQKNARSGTGIGLTVCKKYLELHAGEIELSSELGKGSTFTLCFPSDLSPTVRQAENNPLLSLN